MTMAANKVIVICLGSLVLLWAGVMYADEEPATRFPGVVSQTVSPDGKHVLINIDSEGDSQTAYLGDNHALYLLDLETTKIEKIRSYGRNVEVLWSPKGSALLLSDHRGSDFTDTIIYMLNGKKRQIDMERELRRQMGDNQSIFNNHHVYVTGVGWLGEDKVEIKIWGYGDIDPRGFTLRYEFTIGDGFKKLQ